MRINHNVMALNAHRQLFANQSNMAKSLERLSSGLRINRAGDDAAGLAISEKMRAQISGLNQASRNAQDGISLIQTAEGALNETHSILQRMRELSVQASNGTNTTEDRDAIQAEMSELKDEIDRIGNTTEFNTQKLLNGNMAGTAGVSGSNITTSAVSMKQTAALQTGSVDFGAIDNSPVDLTVNETITIDGHDVTIDWAKHLTDDQETLLDADYSVTNMTADQRADAKDALEGAINAAIDEYNGSNAAGAKVSHVKVWDDGTNLNIQSGVKGEESEISFSGGAVTSVLDNYFGANDDSTAQSATGDNVADFALAGTETPQFSINGIRLETAALAVATAGTTSGDTVAADLESKINTAISTYNGSAGLSSGDEGFIEDVSVDANDGRLVITSPSGTVKFHEEEGESFLEDMGLTQAQTEAADNGALSFQIGANRSQTISLGISDMRSQALGIQSVDVSTLSGAEASIDALDGAIRSVSDERSKLGAYQNRLEHTINNLGTTAENLQAAESRIRDVDMAAEMMNFTKNQILQQASTAMLAQANVAPQGVLQLLG